MSWLDRLKTGLSRTTTKLADNLAGLASGTAPLDEARLDAIEEALITADLGPAVAQRIRQKLEGPRFERGIDEPGLKAAVAEEIAHVLSPYAKPLAITAFPRPHVILVVGVNGVGKTTTIAKLARRFTEADYTVMLAAGDTFRAAAIAQLRIWADRVGVPLISGEQGADAAGLAYTALERAQAAGTDVLIIDTAGRLQNKAGLMDELAKIRRTLQKRSPAAPHDTLLVLDATTGQNALSQIEVFKDVGKVSGLVITKLDGTARGGVIVAAAEKFHLPIHAIGIGEGLDDLRPFEAQDFAAAITGS